MTTASPSTPAALARQPGAPLHHQVFVVMRDAIQSGQYMAGTMLPSEQQLAIDFGVSRVTLRNAMGSLQANGLVVKRQGVGTFVAAHRLDNALHAPHADLLAHIRQVGETTRVQLLDRAESTAPASVCAFFGCDRDLRFQRFVRLRSARGKPLFHVVTYLPKAIATLLPRRGLAAESLHDLLMRLGIRLSSGEQIVGAVLAEPAVARHLATFVGAPLIQVRRFHRDQDGRAVAYVEILASPDDFQVHLKLDGEAPPPRKKR